MDVEAVARVLDRIGGGRKAGLRVPSEHVEHPETRRILADVATGITAAFSLDVAAVLLAVLRTEMGAQLSWIVWTRLVMISLLTASLYYFVWRAQHGWWWAYSRMRLFTIIFPVVAVGTCLVPGLYPTWMIVEQVVLAGILVVVATLLNSRHLRDAYVKPGSGGAGPPAAPPG
jgi:cobalamin synthase